MDMQRALLAIVLSFLILFGYQYVFVGFEQPQENPAEAEQVVAENTAAQPNAVEPVISKPVEQPAAQQTAEPSRPALDITVDTDLYTAVISEQGGAVKSFVLKKHREENDADSPGKQLVRTDESTGFPLKFSWGSLVPANTLYDSSTQNIALSSTNQNGSLVLSQSNANGIAVERTYTFDDEKYFIDMQVKVKNTSANPLQGAAEIHQVNSPFQHLGAASRFLFTGPALYVDESLEEVKAKEFSEGPKVLSGNISWAGYQGTYFACSVAPVGVTNSTFTMQGSEELAKTVLAGPLDTLQPGEEKVYNYRIFYGPKKLTVLTDAEDNFSHAINFGWFDMLAKPTLWLLNFFHKYTHNYGIAIILVTVLFKAIFWPITQKGLMSMKNMQKLQPKMVKLKEKYKDDPQAMNREVMNLYKTYKVNPLGGCLPMVLQIPVFFALYKVLLQSIELRHAPFMLWITDLSAPDRLMIGFDIPFIGGIPVLTLLMGASMFLQQKLSPTTADPTQQRIMMFLPVVFTFMFLNFASGLVLYWFINNLLAILQQYLINQKTKKATA